MTDDHSKLIQMMVTKSFSEEMMFIKYRGLPGEEGREVLQAERTICAKSLRSERA